MAAQLYSGVGGNLQRPVLVLVSQSGQLAEQQHGQQAGQAGVEGGGHHHPLQVQWVG